MNLPVFEADWRDVYNLLALPTAAVLLRACGEGPQIVGAYDVGPLAVPERAHEEISAFLQELEMEGILETMAPVAVFGASDTSISEIVDILSTCQMADEVVSLSAVHRINAVTAAQFASTFPFCLDCPKRLSLPSCIHTISNLLFLGDRDAAQNADTFHHLGIRWVVNCTVADSDDRMSVPNVFEKTAKYLRIDIEDSPDADLYASFSKASDFIADGLGEGAGVLVHCWAGVSRSASIILAYAMQKCALTFDDALEAVRSCRWCIRPNEGFVKQLKAWEQHTRNKGELPDRDTDTP